ncbi:MAG: hypothetical protein ABJA82_01535 [Myxococcales bacterium]
MGRPKRFSNKLCLASAVFTALMVCACGGGAKSGGGPSPTDARAPAHSGRYLPISLGATWTWNATDPATGKSANTTSTVVDMNGLAGTKAGIALFRVVSTTLTGGTVNWQEDTGSAIVRHREQFTDQTGAIVSDYLYNPSKLRLDEAPPHMAAHATWTENYADVVDKAGVATTQTTPVVATWTVVAVDEMVTVPAGSFSCLHVHRVETATAYDSHFWFAKNVGKVKESGMEIKELVAYSIP